MLASVVVKDHDSNQHTLEQLIDWNICGFKDIQSKISMLKAVITHGTPELLKELLHFQVESTWVRIGKQQFRELIDYAALSSVFLLEGMFCNYNCRQ